MDSETIKEFLVKLGFQVDESTSKKFRGFVGEATKVVNAFGIATSVSASGVAAFMTKVSESLDKLYFASQRTGAAVADMKAFGYATSQLGGTADAAQASLENLSHFMRSYPGSEEFLSKLGVSPDHLRNSEKALRDLGETFKRMPFWQAQPYANMLGIDEKTLLALQSGNLNTYLDDYARRLADVGLNSESASRRGNELMSALRSVGAEASVAGDALVERFNGPLISLVKLIETALRGMSLMVSNPAQAGANIKENLGLNNLKSLGSWNKGHTLPDWFYPDKSSKAAPSTWDRVVSYFKAQGWTPEQATGIAANLQRESSMNPAAVGDGGAAYGIAQWHSDRQSLFKAWSGKDIRGSTLEEQLAFIQRELPRNGGSQLAAAKTAREAAEVFSSLYERPKDRFGEARLRGDMADSAYRTPAITQTTTINVSGTDPQAIASAVASRQDDINSKLVRNLQGALQ